MKTRFVGRIMVLIGEELVVRMNHPRLIGLFKEEGIQVSGMPG